MRQRDLGLRLEPGGRGTLIPRLAAAVEAAILDGRLRPGQALPGTRALAESLGVTRNTVVAALQRLEEEGWLVSEPNRGTFVAPRPPSGPARGVPASAAPGAPVPGAGFDLPSRLSPLSAGVQGALDLADGRPDPRLAPMDALAKAYQRALRRHGEELLQDGEPMGNRLLRESLAAWLSERHGAAIPADRVLLTRGTRSALALLAAALLRPGDRVGVEDPGNRGAWEVLSLGGRVSLVPLGVDHSGLRPDALARALEDGPLRALYLTPRRQFPTSATLDADRSRTILALAAEHRVAVLEDDYDGAYHYAEPRILPLLAADATGQVVHLASLSRLLAPGLRLGCLVAPAGLAERLGRVRRDLAVQGDRVLEWAVADLIRDGELSRHLRRASRVYAARREALAGLLRETLGGTLDVEVPGGGLAFWMRVGRGIDAGAWVAGARKQGLLLTPPSWFSFEGHALPYLRLGFAQADETEAAAAVARLKTSLPR